MWWWKDGFSLQKVPMVSNEEKYDGLHILSHLCHIQGNHVVIL